MPAASELIANGRTVDEIRDIIGADRLIYQDLHGLIRSVRHSHSHITEFDTSCFSGEYVTKDVSASYLSDLEKRRSDEAKALRNNADDASQDSYAMASVGDDDAETAVGM